MEDSGLMDFLDRFVVNAITQDDSRNQHLAKLCKTYNFKKLDMYFVQNLYANDTEMLLNLNYLREYHSSSWFG